MSIRLLVVEDEIDIRERYRELLEFHPMIELVGEAETQDEARALLQEKTVDAVILDLELPSGSGMLLMEQLKSLPNGKPFIVVVSHVGSKAIFEAIRGMGADYICSKNETNFSYDTPLAIMEIATPYRSQKEAEENTVKRQNKATLRRLYEKRIRSYFKRMHFPAQLQGTIFCKEAVLYAVMNDVRDVSITREVYTHVAERYSTTSQNVERQIRHVIESVWLNEPLHIIKTSYRYYYNEDMGRPTNGDFIKNVAQIIIRQ